MKPRFDFTKHDRHSVYEQLDGLDWSGISDQLATWEQGQKGYVTITKTGRRKSREQLGYYYGKILPMAFEDFKHDQGITLNFNIGKKHVTLPLTLETVDLFFKLNYAEYNEGVYQDKAEMNMAECAAFEDYVIKWLYTWRNVHVPPADKDWRQKKESDE